MKMKAFTGETAHDCTHKFNVWLTKDPYNLRIIDFKYTEVYINRLHPEDCGVNCSLIILYTW